MECGIDRADLTGIRGADRDYDIFAGGVVAYGEVDLGIVRPFLAFVWGSADGDQTDHKLRGFNPQPFSTTTQMTGTTWFAHLDTSNTFSSRDYACPARFQGLGVANVNTPGVASATNPGAPGIAGRSGPQFATNNPRQVVAGVQNPYASGIGVTNSSPGAGFIECSHGVTNAFNDRFGNTSHLGIESALSNPGTLLIPVGIRVFPLKGYEINAWYMYKAMLNTTLLEAAFAPEIQARRLSGIRKGEYQEVGGSVLWTLNPIFSAQAGLVHWRLQTERPRSRGLQQLRHISHHVPGSRSPHPVSSPAYPGFRCSGRIES